MGSSVLIGSLDDWIVNGSHVAHKLAELETSTIISVLTDVLYWKPLVNSGTPQAVQHGTM